MSIINSAYRIVTPKKFMYKLSFKIGRPINITNFYHKSFEFGKTFTAKLPYMPRTSILLNKNWFHLLFFRLEIIKS